MASKSGKEILAASNAAAASADSVHLVGKASQGRLSSSIDLTLTGAGGRGRVSVLGLDFEVIRIGEKVYVKGDSAFYGRLSAVSGKAVHMPHGTWLKASASSGPLAQLAAFTDLHGELDRMLSTPGPVSKGSTTKVASQKAIELKEKTKVYEGALFVATTGKPYPIEQLKTGGRERGRTSFSGWDQPVSLRPPAPAVELGGLKG